LKIGDILELIIPNQIESLEFKISKLWDFETDEEIDVISPGVKGQLVKIQLPVKCEENWILRRKK